MKTVFHKSGGRQMYQSAARSFRKESTASCRFLQEFIWVQRFFVYRNHNIKGFLKHYLENKKDEYEL